MLDLLLALFPRWAQDAAPAPAAAAAPAVTVSGQVLDGRGQPVADLSVSLRAGLAHYQLTPSFDRWASVLEREVKSDAQGRFEWKDLPAGAVVTAFARRAGEFGLAEGSGELELRLGPTGGLKGKLSAKKGQLLDCRIVVSGPRGFRAGETEIGDNSSFAMADVPPGELRVRVLHGNWSRGEALAQVVPGATASVPLIQVAEPEGADAPLDVHKAKLVDGRGKAVPGVHLIWSGSYMDGSMSSDKDGEILLVGGGVAIGPPPFRLSLADLQGPEQRHYGGTLKKIASGTATIRVDPLRPVQGTVRQGGAALARYRLYAVGAGDAPRVYFGAVADDGRYTLHLPPGPHTLVVGTADGRLQRLELKVEAGAEPLEQDLELP